VALSRRRFLQGAAAAGAGALSLPALVDRAYAAADPARCGTLADIEHFVFVMQENRSFDHYFGALRGVRGFSDPRALASVFEQRGWAPGVGVTDTGVTRPFALAQDKLHDAQVLNDPTHDWGPQHRSWNNGAMDRFLLEHVERDGAANAPIVMSHYDRTTLPFYYALADAFTVCDSYHCSVLGPTYPNRLYWMSGMLDPEGAHGGPLLETLGTSPSAPGARRFTWTTMPEVLEAAGVSWKVYQSADSLDGIGGGLFIDNVLQYFTRIRSDPVLSAKALTPTYPGNFATDVASGKLPQVSWIITDFLQCEHPAAPPQYGAYAIANLIDTLLANPAVWEKTAIILSYDENGGFFDHVPPPTAPAGTPGEFISAPLAGITESEGIAGPIGLGFRVPAMVISPYSRGGLLCSDVLDHTSQLRLLEKRFGVTAPNLTAWRRATVGDFTSAFDFASPIDASRPTLPSVPAIGTDLLVTRELFSNGVSASLAKGKPYPVPMNSVAVQESGPARRAPSGVVACATEPLPTASPAADNAKTQATSKPSGGDELPVAATIAGGSVAALAAGVVIARSRLRGRAGDADS
jgi:phospholipase C